MSNGNGSKDFGPWIVVGSILFLAALLVWISLSVSQLHYEVYKEIASSRAYADAKEMVEIMLLPHEIVDVPLAPELKVTKGEIVFQNLNFSFSGLKTAAMLKIKQFKPDDQTYKADWVSWAHFLGKSQPAPKERSELTSDKLAKRQDRKSVV